VSEDPRPGQAPATSEEPRGAGEPFAEHPKAAAEVEGVVEGTTGMSTGAYRRLFANRNFRRLWYGQFISGIGDWLVIGFLIPLVTKLSGGSSFAVAGILIAKIIPALLFSTFIGVMVDRFDRRRIMIGTELAATALSLGLVFAQSVWVIYFIVMLLETTSLIFWPARNSLIPYLVDEDDVTAANGLAYTTGQASMLIGLTAAAGILAAFEAIVHWVLAAQLPVVNQLVGPLAPALLGPRAGVIIDSFTFLFSAIMVWTMHVSAMPPRKKEPLSLRLIGADVIESFRFLGEHRELRGLLITIGLAILGGGAIIPVGATYVEQNLSGVLPFADRFQQLRELTATPTTFMLVFMAFGMVMGALAVPRFEHRFRLQVLFAGSVAAFGLALFGFASVHTYWVASLFGVVAGACIAIVTVAGNSYIVRTTADELRGRVFTALESVIRISLLISMIVMAPLADLIGRFITDFVVGHDLAPSSVTLNGSRITLQISACIVLGAAVYAFNALRWRSAEEGDDAPPAEEALADA